MLVGYSTPLAPSPFISTNLSNAGKKVCGTEWQFNLLHIFKVLKKHMQINVSNLQTLNLLEFEICL
jgi:hypothetical protein